MESEKIYLVTEETTTSATSIQTDLAGWWTKYSSQLSINGLSESSIQVINLDSDYVVNQGIFGAGHLDVKKHNWPSTRTRRGLVMGAVQSGKTASLIAVISKALDQKVDVVVVLGGTRTALWRQTYERIVSQLDQWSEDIDSDRRVERVLLPSPSAFLSAEAGLGLKDLYFATPNYVRRMLIDKHPLIAVVMKQVDHLENFGKYLHNVLRSTLPKLDRPLHMLVIDDEADDGSILDSEAERGLSIDSDHLKQIPRYIQRLWTGSGTSSETLDQNLYATYVAYTATPQANFLQADHNPLSPSDFIAALRVPSDSGSIEPPRESTFTEPKGLQSYYTGGELFYRRLDGTPGSPCITRDFPVQESNELLEDFVFRVETERKNLLGDALRSYFVSGAIRLHLSKRSLREARNTASDTVFKVRQTLPKPHTMLFHPSARIDSHFIAAQQIVDWSEEFLAPTLNGPIIDPEGNSKLVLNVAGLCARLDAEESEWQKWIKLFDDTSRRLSFFPNASISPKVDDSDWPEIRRLLLEEVFSFSRLTIINSDPRADERPQFEPELEGDGLFAAPRDIYTIFVSGNVMSRGITLEGLATTLFLRSANEPASDSQMQMQRWFGYRGSYLNLCRVFLFTDQYELFRSYHEGDEALRREIIGEMNSKPGIAPKPTVLQGTGFRATGKIANLRALPLCPGADPFIRIIENTTYASHNTDVLASLLCTDEWCDVKVGETLRGQSMQRQLNLLEVAELLESFRYSYHAPNPQGVNHLRWRALESQNNLDFPEAPLFRPPVHIPGGGEIVSPPSCPYSVAAYMRLWSALLTRKARGIIPTDDRDTPWSMIDLREYAVSAPKFYVGIRYGSAGLASDSRLAEKGVLRMDRSAHDGVLVSTWGSRNPGLGENSYLGDQLFDYHIHGGIPPDRVEGEPIWRKRGSPGLVLFHVIRGKNDQADSVTVGLAIPLGGPDHIAALRPST